ncbi:MAG: hypothetical protein AUK35_08460 [Zetaproteobacteria bacterium CG2_30_46_52]|nr:MAG: hypothetical protein AUK35_08460 [Zetaproteobacteria bacterium CG2_30_46_52]
METAPNDIAQSSSTSEESIDTQHLSTVQHNLVINLIGGTFGILVTWYIFHNIMESESIHIWASMAFVAMFLHLGIYWSTKSNYHTYSPKQWKYILAFPSFMGGIVWGSLVLFTPDIDAYTLTMVCIFFAIIGTALGSTGNNLSIFVSFTLPVSTFLIIHLVQLGGHLFLSLAFFAAVYFFVTLSLALKFTQVSSQERLLYLENRNLLQKLAEKVKIADKANEQKSRFLASASHDLRQPIHALTIFAEALEQQLTHSKQHEIFGKIRLSIEATNSLLSSLLDISRLEAGLVKIELHSFHLFSVLYKLEEEFITLAHKKGLTLKVDSQVKSTSDERRVIHDSDVIVHSDIILLENILRNLISNAIRYTNEGAILITCAANETGYLVHIQDTGIGIEKHNLEKIFDEFYQVDNPERDRSKGIGLGLSIVNKLCQLLDLDLKVNSVLGQGTQVDIHLVSAAQADVPVDIFETMNEIQATILVVDDETLILEGMKAMLKPWGYEVLTSQTPEDAMKQIRSNKEIDLLLVDYRLKNHDKGTTIVHEARIALNQPNLPAVIITGDTDPKRIQKMQEEDIEILHKPIKPAQLRGLMQYLLTRDSKSD